MTGWEKARDVDWLFFEKIHGLRVQIKGCRENGHVGHLVADEDMQKIFEMRVLIRNDYYGSFITW